MNEAIILHTLEDARDCVKKKLYRNKLLFSTSSSVDIHLKEHCNIECQCLSSFLTLDEIMRYKNMVSEKVDSILFSLDTEIASSINKQTGLNMKYFWPLYSYVGKHHLSTYVYFVKAVKKIIDKHKLRKIFFYDYSFRDNIDATSDIKSIIPFFFRDIETQILKVSKNVISEVIRLFISALAVFRKIRQNLFSISEELINKLVSSEKYKTFSSDKKTVLMYEYLFEFDFLKKNLNKYNILYYKGDYGNTHPEGFKFNEPNPRLDVDFQIFDFLNDEKGPFTQLFLRDIRKDFTKNIAKYISGVNFLKKIHKQYSISLGIWGTSPIFKFKAFIFEYLKSEGIKVIGAQHGGNYGISYEPTHIDSDFKRCDYFVSYGFTRKDLDKMYPAGGLNCTIMPFGKVKLIKPHRSRKKIDIMFPPAINVPFIKGGMRSINHELTERQIKIIEYLDSLKDLQIYVKPALYMSRERCPMLPVLKRLRNIKVTNDMPLTRFLERYEPKIVVIDFPTQPLYECLFLHDVEIFTMDDKLRTFNKDALSVLRKRVHYSESIEQLIEKLDLFLKGKLEAKRDDSFCHNYVYKNNTERNILSLIDSLMANTTKDSKLVSREKMQDESAISSIR